MQIPKYVVCACFLKIKKKKLLFCCKHNQTLKFLVNSLHGVCDSTILASICYLPAQQYPRETMWPFSHTIGEDGSPVLEIHVEVHTPVLGLLSVVANGEAVGVKSSGSIVQGDEEQ